MRPAHDNVSNDGPVQATIELPQRWRLRPDIELQNLGAQHLGAICRPHLIDDRVYRLAARRHRSEVSMPAQQAQKRGQSKTGVGVLPNPVLAWLREQI